MLSHDIPSDVTSWSIFTDPFIGNIDFRSVLLFQCQLSKYFLLVLVLVAVVVVVEFCCPKKVCNNLKLFIFFNSVVATELFVWISSDERKTITSNLMNETNSWITPFLFSILYIRWKFIN